MFGWLNKSSVSSQVAQLLGTRSRLQQILSGRTVNAHLQKEIDRMQKTLGNLRPIKELSDTAGWKLIESDLSQRILLKLRGLSRLVLSGKWDEAIADSSYIENMNQVLGLVNETLLESARCGQLVNTYISAQERLEEDKQARQR